MKSIVTTIQREQNKIIRNTSADLLFVQGAAGSGKTSAICKELPFFVPLPWQPDFKRRHHV